MSLLDINYQQLVNVLVRRRIRGPRMISWLRSLIAPVLYVYAAFKAERSKALYQVGHSSQVVRIEAMLNDAFDTRFRRIRIADAVEIDSTYAYRRDELKPRYIYRGTEATHTYIRRTEETVLGGPDFIVQVPAGVVYDTARMRALINDYRLASKSNFLIETI